MPIRNSYTDHWQTVHGNALSVITGIHLDYEAVDCEAIVKSYGSDAELLNADVDGRFVETVPIQTIQCTPAMIQAALVLRNEVEKILKAQAKPGSQVPAKLDYTTGTIVPMPTQ